MLGGWTFTIPVVAVPVSCPLPVVVVAGEAVVVVAEAAVDALPHAVA